ncbi:MAG: hypothetical protein Q4G11_07785, partial [Gallicola sp.]|nr:hypothetical protein [Gallicola sp.]
APMIEDYIKDRKTEYTFNDLIEDEGFAIFVKGKIEIARIELNNEMHLVNELMTVGLPQNVEKHSGLDGHSFTLKVYADPEQQYWSWCHLPKEWGVLRDFINAMVERLKLDRSRYGA